MKTNLNNDLTFLLLLKDRHEFTSRFVKFLTEVKFNYKLFIADGSKKKLSKSTLRELHKAKISFNYKRFAYDKNYKIFQKKIYLSLKIIKTKYVWLFSNDDFPIISSINPILNFLEKNKKYIACGGYALNFDILKKYYNINHVYGNPINFGKMMMARSNEEENNYKRVFKYLRTLENTQHYFFRRKILLKNYLYTQKRKINFFNVDFYDYYQDLINFSSGKIKKLKKMTLLHQYHSQNSIDDRLKHNDLMATNTFKKDSIKLLNVIRKKLLINNQKLTKKYFDCKLFRAEKIKKIKKINYFYAFFRSIKFLVFIYNIIINIKMNFINKHVNKLLISIKDKNLKKDLIIIFKFLKKNFY